MKKVLAAILAFQIIYASLAFSLVNVKIPLLQPEIAFAETTPTPTPTATATTTPTPTPAATASPSPTTTVSANNNLNKLFEYSFDSVSGNTVIDSSEKSKDGTISGGAILTSGIKGSAICFDGQGSYITIPSSINLTSSGKYTFSAWVKPRFSTMQNVKDCIVYLGDSYALYIDGTSKTFSLKFKKASGEELVTTLNKFTLEENKWYNVAFSYDGSSLKLFVNGKVISTIVPSGTVKTPTDNLYLGRDTTTYSKGTIDEVVLYNQCLSENEVKSSYTNVIKDIANWDSVSYPEKSTFTSGITSVDESIFKDSEIVYPINTSYEEKNELSDISLNNFDNQLSISEDAYEGKFAVDVNTKTSDIIPIKESNYFFVSGQLTNSETLPTPTSTPTPTPSATPTTVSESGATVEVNQNTVRVYGTTTPNIEVALLVKNSSDAIKYINQTTSDANGLYEFVFSLPENGAYSVRISNVNGSPIILNINIGEPVPTPTLTPNPTATPTPTPDLPITITPEKQTVATKTNLVSLWIKPKFRAETISFYTKAIVNQQEQYVLIKSDKNGDGIYTLGEDFSQGKWQQISINYLKTELKTDDGKASGLYFKSNISSQWLFDSVTSSYLEVNDNIVDLNKFAKGNIVIADNKLKFQASDSALKYFNTTPATATAGLDINEKISGVAVNSTFEKGYSGQIGEQPGIAYLDENTSKFNNSAKWITQNSANYDTVATGASKLVDVILTRNQNDVPVLNNVSEQQISILSGEKRFRIYLNVFYSNRHVEIYDANNVYQETDCQVSKWYYGNIKLKSPTTTLSSCSSILKIEYEPIVPTIFYLGIKPQGQVNLANHNIVTTDRVKVKLKAKFDGALSTDKKYLQIKSPNGTPEGYITKVLISGNTTNEIEVIIPPIMGSGDFVITNLDDSKSAILEYFNIYSVVESDFNSQKKYYDNVITSKKFYNNFTPIATDTYEICNIQKYYGTENTAYKFVEHLNTNGIKTKTGEASPHVITSTGGVITVLRFINLNNDSSLKNFIKVTFDGSSTAQNIYLNYGECDLILPTGINGSISLPSADANILLLGITQYSTATVSNNTNSTIYDIDGFNSSDNYSFSNDGSILYYTNNYELGGLYYYDFNSISYHEITKSYVSYILSSPDGQKAVYKLGADYYLYDKATNVSNIILNSDAYTFYFDVNSNLFAYCYGETTNELVDSGSSICKFTTSTCILEHSDGQMNLIINDKDTTAQSYNLMNPVPKVELIFDNHGEYMVKTFAFYPYEYYRYDAWSYYPVWGLYDNSLKLYLYKKSGNSWLFIKKIDLLRNDNGGIYKGSWFGADSNTVYISRTNGTYSLDLITGIIKKLDDVSGDLISVYEDGRLNLGNSYLYNPITKEKEYTNNNAMANPKYNAEANQMTFVLNGNVVKYLIDSRKTPEKYLLSFDGKSSWYAYRGGRWILSSNNIEPTYEEISQSGMTAAEVTAIQPVDFDKIYLDGTEVYTVNIAIGMESKSIYITPVINNITVKTISNQPVKCLYSSKIQKYTKADYNKVNGIFPIEDFIKPAESYYLLYLGNEWIYTYKNDKLVKLTSTAEELFKDVNKNWMEIKQYGMDAKELRNIPSDILTKLFLNKNFANSEFGFISAIKTYDNSTQQYKIDFRLQSDTNYFEGDQLVLEIVINGTETKTYLPTDIAKEEIDKFMSWLDGRQQGKGQIFYRLKTTGKQSFLNYYMITSVNVYDYEEYLKMETPTTLANSASTQTTTPETTSPETPTDTSTNP
jgi:hypothetical protein